MDDPSEDYLQDGFDPATITVPRLRSILVTHNVNYPATAKKQVLMDLFNEHVAPQASKILAVKAHARRTSRGIVNAERYDEDSVIPQPPTVARRSRSPRKPSVKQSESTAAPSGRISREHSQRVSMTESSEPAQISRKPPRVRRTLTSVIDFEPRADTGVTESVEEDAVFSSENPFQSGSSPSAPSRPSSSRRKTTSFGQTQTSLAIEPRRRTEGHVDNTRGFDFSTGPLVTKRLSFQSDLKMEPGEEFTPEAQAELDQSLVRRPNSEIISVNRPPKRRVRLGTPISVLFLTLLGAYLAWYRQEKIGVGYCGIGRSSTQILPTDFSTPDWVTSSITPQCEPCPAHAFCYADYSVVCESDFVLKPHVLAFRGLVPLPPTCEPDGDKARKVKAVADKAIEELREQRAHFECGDLVDEDNISEPSPALETGKLKAAVASKRSKRLSQQEFDDLWTAALGEIRAREEVEVIESESTDPGAGAKIFYSSHSLARLSFACFVTRSTRLRLVQYRVPIGSIIGIATVLLYGFRRYREYTATSARIPALVDTVLARLAAQWEFGAEDNDDTWLLLPNLRDDVLRGIHSLSEREQIWRRVRAVVEQNSNVRTSQHESRSGEVGRAWEWIGPIGAGAVARRRSGRVSFALEVKPDPEPVEKVGFHSKWQEPRPVF